MRYILSIIMILENSGIEREHTYFKCSIVISRLEISVRLVSQDLFTYIGAYRLSLPLQIRGADSFVSLLSLLRNFLVVRSNHWILNLRLISNILYISRYENEVSYLRITYVRSSVLSEVFETFHSNLSSDIPHGWGQIIPILMESAIVFYISHVLLGLFPSYLL